MHEPSFARVLCTAALALPSFGQQLLRTISGPAASEQFGKACIRVADQNGDGVADVLVGAPGFNSQRGAILSGATEVVVR